MKTVRKSVFKNDKVRPVLVHLNSSVQYEIPLLSTDQLGAVILYIEKRLNITIDETRYGLFTSDGLQINLNALMKQIKQTEFWLKPEYDITRENVHKVFGVPLNQVVDKNSAIKVPFVLHKCFEFLEKERSLRTVGLFRLTGNKNEVERFKRLFESPTARSIDFPNSIDPNIVTGIVKAFFREMPEPLLTFANFSVFSEIGETIDEAQRMRRLKSVVHQLPELNLQLLSFLIEYLVRLVMYSDRNRLSSSSLAVVFGPLLLRSPSKIGGGGADGSSDAATEDALSKRRGLSQRIKNIYIHTIGDMIDNYTFVFEQPSAEDLERFGSHSNMSSSNNGGDSSGVDNDDPSKKKFHLNLSKLGALKGDSSSSQSDQDSSQQQTTISLTGGKTLSINQAGMGTARGVETAAPKLDKGAFFTQLKGASLMNQKNSLKNVGVKRADGPNMGSLVTPRNAGNVSTVDIAMNAMASDAHRKIILDLEEKLAAEQSNAERLKEEKELISREAMQKRKELNDELDEYHEKYKLMKNEVDRAKNKWDMQEQEYRSQIQRLEDEISRLKKESLAHKLASDSNRYNIHGSAAEEDKLSARKSLTGQVQVSNRFKRASRRLTEEMMTPISTPSKDDSDSSDDSSSEEEKKTPVSRSSSRDSGTRKRFSSVHGQQPNLFNDNAKEEKKPTPKKEDYFAKCAGCTKGINHGDSYVMAKGINYHTSCFTCHGCKNSINGAFAEKQGKFYCKECLDKMKAGVQLESKPNDTPVSPAAQLSEDACGRCGSDIPKSEKVRALKRQFHKNCFKCFKCNCEFVDNKFYSLDGDPVCIDCKKESLKK